MRRLARLALEHLARMRWAGLFCRVCGTRLPRIRQGTACDTCSRWALAVRMAHETARRYHQANSGWDWGEEAVVINAGHVFKIK